MMKISEIILWAQKAGLQFDFEGNPEDQISGFSSLSHYKKDTITWIKKKAPDDKELLSRIKCVVIQKGVNTIVQNKFISSNSKELFFAILGHFFSTSMKAETIGKGTVIGEKASLGRDIRIGSNCVLDGLIQIGDRTVIEHNVSIMNHVVIGEDCIIHSGTIIGKDGFGFAYNDELIPKKVPHFGGVLIGDRVEIGANCTIDRGTIDDTIIGNDVKIDNLVQIAHNVEIGEGTLVLGCTDIAGSAKIGPKSYIGPQVCIKNQISVGNNSFVGMDVMVNEHVGDNMMIVKSNANKMSKNQNYRRFL